MAAVSIRIDYKSSALSHRIPSTLTLPGQPLLALREIRLRYRFSVESGHEGGPN